MEHASTVELWLGLGALILAAKAGGELAARLRQPPVLGELFAGVVLGNLAHANVPFFRHIGEEEAIAFLAELGVVLLLFEVGLESTVAQMRRIGAPATRVAIIGVLVPMALGYGASAMMLPSAPYVLHLFVGATLSATSVGITARVLKDANATDRPEAQVVLGAAVLDDVLGLIVLAVVSAIAARGEVPPPLELGWLVASAALFLIGALVLGRYVMPTVFRGAASLETDGVLAALAIGLCFLFAGASALAGLAPIVGAFAAGLVLDEVHVRPFGHTSKHDLADLVRPIVAALAPVFFVVTGMKVDLGMLSLETLALTAALVVAATAGKLAAGLGAPKLDWLTIGVGMLPRGEVGLIFAATGAAITVGGEPLIDDEVYAAIVVMVAVTTLVAPPWLAVRLRRSEKSDAMQESDGRGPVP